MARKVFTTTTRAGSGTDGGAAATVSAMTAISKDTAANGDMCFIAEDDGSGFYVYKYNATGTASTSAPNVYRPNNYTTAGTWENQQSPFTTPLGHPHFHAQDHKAYNVDGGSSTADAWTTHVLNNVIHNNITGASLASNEVLLPAGKYHVKGSLVLVSGATAASKYAGIFVDGALALRGVGEYLSLTAGAGANRAEVEGIITLTASGAVTLKYYTGIALATIGLGVCNNTGGITDAAFVSVYADIQIWQLTESIDYA